ncbi:RNA recognition motif protein (macronuclear) [Tetrahymena thermophila SB210]|uniref:RNA recognition motif protein n=1 Tax=Tetrahymena thermophila (strain SB210) TaxID=312017 RepID=Q22R89_TETTS|nr:RNA recognition motif protein [Tetrahymena thermophila SB210]EAR88233.2 RNA recognition motif protein [Tetrahymena thermophila SB210]|eukprot:XP_001008478.2 RNA recognition motif protein [Tetrahymena thermophila SB210]
MSDMNNMMRMPGQPPNGMPMQPPMNLNPQMIPGQMVPPPFMGPGNQPMRQMPMNNQQPPMFPPQQIPGMPPFPHHMGHPPPHGMMNQFQQFPPMNQMPNMPPFQPPNFQVPPPMMGQQPQIQVAPSIHAPPLLNNAPQNPNMIRETITGGPSAIPSSSAPPSNTSSSDSQWLKLFVNNIHPDVPDEFIKKLLEECGQVEKWKRQSDEKGNLNKFGIVEYKMFESVLKCIRILDGFEIMDEKLVVKSSQTTQTFIEQWKQLKSKKWEEEQKQKASTEFESFDQFLEKDDSVIRERIELHMKSIDEKVEKVREKKREDEEKKLHPREKDRDNKKKQQQREIEKKGKEKLKEWLQVEEDMAREKRKEREREKERDRIRQKALERELTYTDDIDRHKQRGRMMERKRQRQRELEEDENDRKKELELLNPPEPEFNIPMPEEPLDDYEPSSSNGINGQHNHTDKIDRGVINLNFEEIDLSQSKKPNEEVIEYTIENPRNNIINQTINKLNIQFKQDFSDKIQKGEYVMPAMEEEYQEPVANINEYHSSRAMQIESDNKDPSIKQIFGNLDEEEEEERQRNLRKTELPKIGHARFVEQREIIRKQQNESGEEKTPAPRQLSEEEMKKELKEILQRVPPISGNNSALFSFNFNWELFEKSGLLDKKIKPFLLKKSQELLGQEEQGFVDLIVKKFTQRPTPEKLVRQIVKILDEDESEKFIASLWRIMIFETLKYEKFLHIV